MSLFWRWTFLSAEVTGASSLDCGMIVVISSRPTKWFHHFSSCRSQHFASFYIWTLVGFSSFMTSCGGTFKIWTFSLCPLCYHSIFTWTWLSLIFPSFTCDNFFGRKWWPSYWLHSLVQGIDIVTVLSFKAVWVFHFVFARAFRDNCFIFKTFGKIQ
jgi:hypothetical protein